MVIIFVTKTDTLLYKIPPVLWYQTHKLNLSWSILDRCAILATKSVDLIILKFYLSVFYDFSGNYDHGSYVINRPLFSRWIMVDIVVVWCQCLIFRRKIIRWILESQTDIKPRQTTSQLTLLSSLTVLA